MTTELPPPSLDQIFRQARTYSGWSDTPLDEATVHDLYDLLKWGPTSANSSPARFVWVRSPEGKAKLAAHAFDKNKQKILDAPLTVIIGNDLEFASELPSSCPTTLKASVIHQRRRRRSVGIVTLI